jgi:aryl-alcohol dehydrogenase-like predicted oxidoreductase
MEAVNKLISQGKVRYAGVCNYNVEQMLETEKQIKLISNQMPYSMVKRRIEKDVVPYCLENNKSILAYSPLERGLLTGKMQPGHQFGEGDHRAGVGFFKDVNLVKTNEFLLRIKPIADERKLSLGQLVILWTLAQPGITVALVGARNASQAIQNAKAMEVHLNPDEIETISQELDQLILVD